MPLPPYFAVRVALALIIAAVIAIGLPVGWASATVQGQVATQHEATQQDAAKHEATQQDAAKHADEQQEASQAVVEIRGTFAAPSPTASTRSEKSIPNAGILITGLQDARSVRVSTRGNLFIVETGRHRILKTDSDGVRLDSVGRLGNGDYQLDEPAAIDPTNELKIYVADRNNRRIQVFDGRLQYLSTIKLPHRSGQAARFTPSLLTVDPSGNIYFYDEEQQMVYRFDSSGRYDLDFGLHSEEERIDPVSMTVLDDVIWAVCRRGNLLHRFASHGAYLGFLYTPEHILEVRAVKGHLWLLGSEHVMQVSAGGEVLAAIPLPAAPQRKTQRRFRSSSPPAMWRSFAVRDQTIYLLDGQTLVGIQVETDER